MKTKGILYGAAILTATSLITKILGFIYRVYMSNEIGAEGMGLFQLIMPVYMLCWSIGASGFTTTVSRLVAFEKAKGESGNIRRILSQCIMTTFIISVILSIIVYNYAQEIGRNIFNDERTVLSLKILSSCFVFMSVGSCIRGYFFSLNETIIPATSQVFEQVIRMCIVFFLAKRFIPLGLEYACAVAVIGMCGGEIMSFFYVYIFYKYYKTKYKSKKKPTLSRISSYKLIMKMAIPLTLNRISGSLLSSIENILIPISLQKYGLNQSDAMSVFGNLTGMAMPLIMFPSSFLTALCVCIVPVVSGCMATENTIRIKNIVTKSIVFTIIIGLGTGAIFVTFPYETGYIIYKDNMKDMLFLMGLISPFLYLQSILSGVLNGLGQQVFIFRNSLISSAITIGFIYFLMPIYGINAFIFGWFVSLIAVGFLDIKRVIKITKVQLHLTNQLVKPFLSAILSCFSAKIIYNFLNRYLGSLSVIFSIIYLISLYMSLLIFTGCLKKGDFKKYIKSVIK